jgi:hypothetical protein
LGLWSSAASCPKPELFLEYFVCLLGLGWEGKSDPCNSIWTRRESPILFFFKELYIRNLRSEVFGTCNGIIINLTYVTLMKSSLDTLSACKTVLDLHTFMVS